MVQISGSQDLPSVTLCPKLSSEEPQNITTHSKSTVKLLIDKNTQSLKVLKMEDGYNFEKLGNQFGSAFSDLQ